jgi:HEAT repeat protein
LAQIGLPAVPTLIAALRNRQVERRQEIVEILSCVGDKAVPTLSEALGEADLRRQAAQALVRIASKSAASALKQADKEYHVPSDCAICYALSQFGLK